MSLLDEFLGVLVDDALRICLHLFLEAIKHVVKFQVVDSTATESYLLSSTSRGHATRLDFSDSFSYSRLSPLLDPA